MATFSVNDSIFNTGWNSQTIALAVHLFALGFRDGWGLIHEKPASFAEAVKQTEEEIAANLTILVGEKVFFRYEAQGQAYLATRKYQDHQARKYFPGRGPTCPIPPPAVFRRLSRKTREIFGKCPEKLSPLVAVAVAAAVAVDPPGVPKSCPYCSWSSMNEGASIPEGPRFRAQRFHDAAKRILRTPCYPLTGKTLNLLARASSLHGEARLLEWWDDFLRRPGGDSGHSVELFNSRLQGYAEQQARRDENIDDTRPG